MDYFDSHISSSPVHANVSTTTASYTYTNDHLQFDIQSTSVQSESLHSHEHTSTHEEKCNLEYKKGCSESNSSTLDISANNAHNSQYASASECSILANRMYESSHKIEMATENVCLKLASFEEELLQLVDEEKLKEILAYCKKMDEAKKHKASQLQNNIISGNDDARDNILMPTTGSDVSEPNQLEQDMNLSNDDTKSLSLNEKLDGNQSIVLTSSTFDCSQSEEVLATTLSLSSKTDCSQSAEDIVFQHPNPDCIKSDHPSNTDPKCLLLSNIKLIENKKAVRLMAQLIKFYKFYYLLYLNKRWLNSQ